MDSNTFDRLSRHIGVPGTRRAVFRTLLSAGLLGTTLGTAEAKGKARRKRKKNRRGRARAQGRIKQGNHCISPSGADLNEVFNISAQIVAQDPPDPPFFQGCNEVGSGERWTVAQQVWLVAQTCDDVPPGFKCAGDNTPLADFLAKFEGVKYVIDRGTSRERTVVIPSGNTLMVVDMDDEFDFISPTPLGTLGPLPVGPHVVEAYWVLADMHCDGFGPDPELQCLPAGETLFITVEFRVTPGHN